MFFVTKNDLKEFKQIYSHPERTNAYFCFMTLCGRVVYRIGKSKLCTDSKVPHGDVIVTDFYGIEHTSNKVN